MAKMFKIPFHKNGNQLHYPDVFQTYNKNKEIVTIDNSIWVDNYEFDDVLTYIEFDRGRSSAYFIWSSKSGKKFTMFLIDLHDAIKHLVDGKLTGTFTFCKRGTNYGVKLLKSKQNQ